MHLFFFGLPALLCSGLGFGCTLCGCPPLSGGPGPSECARCVCTLLFCCRADVLLSIVLLLLWNKHAIVFLLKVAGSWQ